MEPIFTKIINELGRSIESEAGIKVPEQAEKEFDLGSDSDDEQPMGVDIDTNFIDEKAAAVGALGNLSLNCSGLMAPHMERLMTILEDI